MPAALLEAAPGRLIDDLGAGMLALYSGIEADLQREIARRVAAHLGERPDLLARLAAIRELEDRARAILQGADPETLAAGIIGTAAEAGVAVAVAQLELGRGLIGGSLPGSTQVDAVAALRLDLQNRLTIMHRRIVRDIPDVYQQVTAQVVPGFIVGGQSIRTVQAELAAQLLARGITGYVDARGRQWRIGTYAEMATRTTALRALSDAGIARMRRSGLTLVTPVGSRAACPLCAPWQGKVLSTDGTRPGVYTMASLLDPTRLEVVRVDATLDEARSAGLQHPNCRDAMAPVMPGLPMPVDVPPGFEVGVDAAAARATAKLRSLEVAVRDAKRRAAVALELGMDAEAAEYRRVIRARQADIREHVTRTGVTRRNYREQLTFSDGGSANPRG